MIYFSGIFGFFIFLTGVVALKSFISLGDIVDLKVEDYIDDVPSNVHFNTL